MSTFRQALLEMRLRWASALAMTLVVAAGVASCLLMAWLGEASVRETKRVQRDLGRNLRVVPAAANVEDYLLKGYSNATMPEELLAKLADVKTVSYNHLEAWLMQRVDAGGGPAIMTGISDTLYPPGHKKPPMRPPLEPGAAQLGSALASRLGLGVGDAFTLPVGELKVTKVVAETGGIDDLRVWTTLKDAQRLTDRADQISEIHAIDCLCQTPEEDPQAQLRREITAISPGVQVFLNSPMATTRALQRRMSTGLAATLTPIVALAGAATLGGLSLQNTRARAPEFALLRAMGEPPTRAAKLVAWRVFFATAIGALLGGAIAYTVAGDLLPARFPVTGRMPATATMDAARYGVAALVLAAAASIAPLMLAAGQSVAQVLKDDS